MPVVAGIDCGSGFTKAVVLCQEPGSGNPPVLLGRGRARSGVNMEAAATEALVAAAEDASVLRADIEYVATTGFGRYSISYRDIQVTEITSGARGAHRLYPTASSVLDIGAQSTRAIALGERGRVKAFKTNDKCAAGSGMFIVRAAKYLDVALEQVGSLSLAAENPQPISSVCAVLAESEIINHVSAGVTVEDILCGIHDSLADRAATLLKRVGVSGGSGEITLIGGVAYQGGLVRALEKRLDCRINVPADCDYVCALGAGLLGLQRLAAKQQLAASG